MKLFSGSANKPLAKKISKELGVALSPLEIHIFPDGEKRVRVEDSVVDEDCVVVQPTNPPADSHYMELFFIVDAIKRSGAATATVVMPYVGYQRQDHVFRSGEAVSLDVVIKTLVTGGVDRIITLDLHSVRIAQAFNISITHLSALPLFAEKIKVMNIVDAILISPDMGGIRRIKLISQMLGNMPYGAVEKHRNLETGSVEASEITELTGDIKKRAIIVDDMISSGRTIETAANLLHEKGAEEVYVFATHPVFSDDAAAVLQNAQVKKVFVTDTIYVPKEKQFPKLEILSVADMIAESIQDDKRIEHRR